jgi:hypothetical protein
MDTPLKLKLKRSGSFNKSIRELDAFKTNEKIPTEIFKNSDLASNYVANLIKKEILDS